MDYNIIAFIDSIKLAMGALATVILLALVIGTIIYAVIRSYDEHKEE